MAIGKRTVYYNGFELLNNTTRIAAVRGRGFTHAVVLDSASPAAMRGLSLQGISPVINIGWGLHPCGEEDSKCCYSNVTVASCRQFSPFVNASFYLSRVARVAAVLHRANGWAIGSFNDIELPPWPAKTFGADGSPSTYNFSDLPERISESASAADWPSFADWPVPGAHKLRNGHKLTIEQIEYNMPKQVSTTVAPTRGAVQLLHLGGSVTMLAQKFTATSIQLTRIDVQMWRHTLPPSKNGMLQFFVAPLNSNGEPDLANSALCASRKPTESATWVYCGVRSDELPPLPPLLVPQDSSSKSEDGNWLSLYVDPRATILLIGRTYAVVIKLLVDVKSKHPSLEVSLGGRPSDSNRVVSHHPSAFPSACVYVHHRCVGKLTALTVRMTTGHVSVAVEQHSGCVGSYKYDTWHVHLRSRNNLTRHV